MPNLKSRIFKIVVCALAFVGVGYTSSAISQVRAEDHAALQLVEGPMAGKPFYTLVGDQASTVIFNRVGAKTTIFSVYPVSNKKVKRVVWPTGKEMPSIDNGGRVATVSYARITWPFLVDIEYSSSEASLSGGGGTRYYLCLFGVIFQVKDEGTWVS